MKFVLAFTGSRGDVQPAVALGVELTRRGHDVTLAAPPNLVEFGCRAGLDTRPYGPDTGRLLASDLVASRLRSPDPRVRLRAITELTVRDGRAMQTELLALAQGADAVVGGSAGQERALNVAQALSIPYVPLHYCPLRRNGVVSLLPFSGGPAVAHRLGWTALEQLLWRASRAAERDLAADLGLPVPEHPAASRIARRGVPEIQAYDPALFPGLTREWGAARPLTGFLDLTPETRAAIDPVADADLRDWLDAGPPPLYVGFGSMKLADPRRLVDTVAEVTDRLGLRVLWAAGWGGVDAIADDRVKVVSSVDHARVLPRCAAVVHHGGAGSTAAGLRAGRATLVCTHGADQPLWGRRIRALGVGTSMPADRIDADALTAALAVVLSPDSRAAAEALAEAFIPAEVAVTAVADLIERAATPTGPSAPTPKGNPVSELSLSVVIPAYNEQEVIGECLRRLTDQLDVVTEIVVVDNNSTDDTAAIVRAVARRHPQVVLIEESRQGLVFARNRGLDTARGDLIARIDADTLVPATWARTVVEFFGADTEGRWAAACGRGEAYGLPYGDRLGALKQRVRERGREVKRVPVLYGSNMILRRGTWAAIRDRVAMRRDVFEDVDTGLCVEATGGHNAFLPGLTVGVAPRRMETGVPAFARYMACLPRTLLLHRRYAMAAGTAFVYVPAITVLHAARLVLLRTHDSRAGGFSVRHLLRRTEDRVLP